MLACVFISSGYDAMRHPDSKVAVAEPVVARLSSTLPVSCETRELVRLNATVQVAAGTLLALGRVPRLAAALLAVSLVPTTIAGHRFWEQQDPKARTQQRIQFLKNLGLLGGLILALFDSAGTPSPGWRTSRAARGARQVASGDR